jgi:hypothetical protein
LLLGIRPGPLTSVMNESLSHLLAQAMQSKL